MKKCFFRSFDVGIGDCNVIRIVNDGGRQYAIMVDRHYSFVKDIQMILCTVLGKNMKYNNEII